MLSDTIEGRIFLMLDEKLIEIARTVGKVDDQGNVAEDLRAQLASYQSDSTTTVCTKRLYLTPN